MARRHLIRFPLYFSLRIGRRNRWILFPRETETSKAIITSHILRIALTSFMLAWEWGNIAHFNKRLAVLDLKFRLVRFSLSLILPRSGMSKKYLFALLAACSSAVALFTRVRTSPDLLPLKILWRNLPTYLFNLLLNWPWKESQQSKVRQQFCGLQVFSKWSSSPILQLDSSPHWSGCLCPSQLVQLTLLTRSAIFSS